jgi:DNA-binding transcriptional ArsR family regulator
MGWEATRWANRASIVASLDATKRGILWAAAPYVIDETGWLPRPVFWLAKHSGLSKRTLERHLPPLAKLEYLVRGDEGFRLPAYLRDRQIGGGVRQIAEKEKERTKEKEKGNTEITYYQESSNPERKPTIHVNTLAVLALFEALPHTCGSSTKADQDEAEHWLAEGCCLNSIAAAMIIGLSRHIASGGKDATPEPVQALRFFRQIVREFRESNPKEFPHYPAARMAAYRLGQLPDLARRKREFYERVLAEIR